MKFSTILLAIVLSWILTTAFAQSSGRKSVELQDLEVYQKSLKLYYNKLWTAKRKEFADLNIKGWVYYLPSVGFQFGLPSIQFSSKEILNYKRDRKLNESKLKSIDAQMELELNQQLQELKTEYVKIEYFNSKLKTQTLLTEAKEKIWKIQKECCQKNECTPLECQKINLEIIQNFQVEKDLANQVILMILELEKLAKYGMPEEKIYFNKQECILESEEFKLFKKN